ncbi:MAG: hypothetical protein GEU80_13960 [Dehalococcoidia bacterium]|nr:hypothetical protein [Dehalococcoidia bacterium]
MTRDDAQPARALEWVARLPLLGDPELAGLLGVAPEDARRLLHGLTKLGWTESVEPGSPELEPRRLWLVRIEALPALAAMLGLSPSALVQAAPVRRRDGFERIARVGLAVGVNRFFADLAADVRRSGATRLVEARSVPTAMPRRERWWLPGTDGYACLSAGTLRAPILLAWDRAGAPDIHRRRRVAIWLAASNGVAAVWGEEGLPTLLVVCPSDRQVKVWERALLACEQASIGLPLEVLLTTRDRLRVDGPGTSVWRAPGRDGTDLLVERVGWGTVPPPVMPIRLPRPLAETLGPPRRSGPSIREWAAVQATARADAPAWQRLAVLALATGPAGQRLIEWVGRHPLVSAAELASLVNEPLALLIRRLEWLVRCGAISEHDDRFVLTDLGMRLLAAQAGVPPPTFARHGGVTFMDLRLPDASQRTTRHREHTIGVNRFFAQLARDARRIGWRLAEWRNEAESTHRWIDRDGRTAWIRPDSSGVLQRGGGRFCFLLEYDRGTLDAGDYRPKFEGYRRYFAEREWEDDYPKEPVLLFACSDANAETRVARAARAGAPTLALLITDEQRYLPDNAVGALGATWRDQHHTRRLHAFSARGNVMASMHERYEARDPHGSRRPRPPREVMKADPT